MNIRQETTHKKNTQPEEANGRRFTTPLRKAFKRLHVARKKPMNAPVRSLADCPNAPVEINVAHVTEVAVLDQRPDPPPAPRPSRVASPVAPPSPISPLPTSVSRSGNLLTIRSKEACVEESPIQLQAPITSDNIVAECSSPIHVPPRGDLFQLGLTPVQSIQSIAEAECPVFAPDLPAVQRVSTINMARLTADVDMMDIVNVDLDDEAQAVTPTPPSRNTSTQWLPALASRRKAASSNLSTTAVFEGGHLAERRRSTFMSKLVGSAWDFAGFTSLNGHRRTQSAAPSTSVQQPKSEVMESLPSIPIGKCSLERAVFGSDCVATTRRLSVSNRNSLVSGLAPANSTLRMTGSKSARELDHLEPENESENLAPGAQVEERPKKKRRSSVANAQNLMRSAAPSPSPVRVTRAMVARQAAIETNTPARVTRSASKRLAELANSPTGKANVVRSKSVKRL
ncbi:hypothetical protein OPQ81_003232 [Rhizoctonia solani]|nr:hypothetical protein OPQ81_003232 [Rhizoctonia solani]